MESCTLHPTKIVTPGCLPSTVGDVREPEITLPNLIPNVADVYILRPFVWEPTSGTFTVGEPQLYFDTRAQNFGSVPMQLTVDGVPNTTSAAVTQCVSWTAARLCRDQRPVGGFAWHPEHSHYHFTEFAAYELRRLTVDGAPDYSASGLVAVSDKVSFCLMDSGPMDPDAVPVRTYAACTPAVQGISPGWMDIYSADLPGQQFPLDGLDDGRYALVVNMDYENRLFETHDDDNVIEVTLEISEDRTKVDILGRHYP